VTDTYIGRYIFVHIFIMSKGTFA